MRTTFAACFAQVGQQAPLVHCISNLVSANDCANIVLAAGASPIMADDPEEAAEITAQSKGLCLSLGTPSPRKAQAMLRAGCAANARQLPVVFDPVGVGASAFRQSIAKELLEQVHPTVVRCNAAELRALVRQVRMPGGVDAAPDAQPEELAALAKTAALQLGCIVAVTGADDLVTDGRTGFCIHNGTPLLRRVTGAGCMLSVLTAAFAAANPGRPLEAAAAAVCTMGLCGETAAARLTGAEGTGTLRTYLIDAVSRLTPEQLEQGANYGSCL